MYKNELIIQSIDLTNELTYLNRELTSSVKAGANYEELQDLYEKIKTVHEKLRILHEKMKR